MKLYLPGWLLLNILLLASCSNDSGNTATKNQQLSNGKDSSNKVSHDSTVTNFLDTAQDDETITLIDQLENFEDTASRDITINLKSDVSVSAELYKDLRDKNQIGSGVVSMVTPMEARLLNSILPFSEMEKKYFDLLSGLAKEAVFLSNRSNFNYQKEGTLQPKQVGLAYSWGQKQFTKREKPPGQTDTCNYKVYGLDCSGFVFQIFKRNGVIIPQGRADDQRKISTLRKALIPYFTDSNFIVQDLGHIEISELKTGDVIYIKNKNGDVSHIGIILKSAAGEGFFECSGSPNKCESNLSGSRGPRMSKMDKRLERLNYSVVRISLSR